MMIDKFLGEKLPMSNREGLMKLRAWSHWYLICRDSKYQPGFKKLKEGLEIANKSLRGDSRKTVLRLARRGRCVNCNINLPNVTNGDHIIPLSKGGALSVENFMPLCKRCNSSKGNKDLLDWWINFQGKRIEQLDFDALCVYSRFMFRILEKDGSLDKPAPNYYLNAVKQAEETLPDELKRYFQEFTY